MQTKMLEVQSVKLVPIGRPDSYNCPNCDDGFIESLPLTGNACLRCDQCGMEFMLVLDEKK